MARKPSKALSPRKQSGNARPQRNSGNGRFLPGNTVGSAGQMGLDASQARRRLNALSLTTMADAWARGGRQAVDKVMKQQPAMFVKLALLTLPREMEITQKGGPKAMSDDAIAQAISTIEAMLAKRAPRPGDDAKLIEGVAEEDVSAKGT